MNHFELIDELVLASVDALGDKLVGVYLHGSLAMGCFNPHKSDIDILIVVNGEISKPRKYQLMQKIVELNAFAPPKGLELSVLKAEYCKPFVYPTPFELHFSPMHLKWFLTDSDGYVEKMNGLDEDIAAHVMITNKYGKTLHGKPISEVFGKVPKEEYFASIMSDISNAKESILSDGMYIVLNLCRVLAFAQEELCLSKEAGVLWCLKHVPECCQSIIAQALEAYKSDKTFCADEEQLVEFAQYMLDKITACCPLN